MTYLQAFILAIVEGLTEFIPVSSTAHILLADKLLGGVANRELFASFSIFVQLGAMLAVLSIFLKQLWQNKNIWGKIILAFIPTVVIGAFFYPLVKAYLQDASPLTGWALLGGGLLFTTLDYYWQKQSITQQKSSSHNNQAPYLETVEKASWWQLLLIGTGQTAAIIPGVSRSASTIFTARAVGFSQLAATQFSFILALPTIAAASGFDLLQEFLHRQTPGVYSVFNQSQDLWLMIFGAVIAFLVALFTCNFFIKILGKKPFFWWGAYRLLVGLFWLWLF